jgi:hypothetical protein
MDTLPGVVDNRPTQRRPREWLVTVTPCKDRTLITCMERRWTGTGPGVRLFDQGSTRVVTMADFEANPHAALREALAAAGACLEA